MSTARKIEKEGSFVKLETNKEFAKFWKLVKNNFDSSKKDMIKDFQKWKENNNIKIQDICLHLDMSPRQYYRIMNEEENITLMTISEMASMMGKKLKINFE